MDWNEIRRFSRSDERPQEWPDAVQSISGEGLALLGIDNENKLYWDGKRVPTVKLTLMEKTALYLATIFTGITAVAALASAWADWAK